MLSSKGALENKKSYFIKLFGLIDSLKMGLKYTSSKLLNSLDGLFNYQFLKVKKSVLAISRQHGIKLYETENINNTSTIVSIKESNPEIIMSFSAPQIFKKELLSITKNPIVNIHGSYLPCYRGIMPSFWTLLNEEQYAGATLHFMGEKIDNGSIILQEKIDIRNCKTVFQVIKQTKELGGRLATEYLKLYNENSLPKPKINDINKGAYFSWPKKEDVLLLYKRGYRLV